MQILQQHGNIALSFNIQVAQSHTKPIDISKLTTGHFIAPQREEIQLHPPEHLTRRRKGEIKRRERDLGSTLFPKCSP